MTKKIEIKNLNISYGNKIVVKNLNLDIFQNEVLAIIGPANSGKTSLLRSINRMTDFNNEVKVEGKILLDGLDIFEDEDSTFLRRRVGMVSPLPVGLPMSIKDNVTYAPRMADVKIKPSLILFLKTV